MTFTDFRRGIDDGWMVSYWSDWGGFVVEFFCSLTIRLLFQSDADLKLNNDHKSNCIAKLFDKLYIGKAAHI